MSDRVEMFARTSAIVAREVARDLRQRMTSGRCFLFRMHDIGNALRDCLDVSKDKIPADLTGLLIAVCFTVAPNGAVVLVNQVVKREEILDWCAKQTNGGFVGHITRSEHGKSIGFIKVFCSTPELAVGFKLEFS